MGIFDFFKKKENTKKNDLKEKVHTTTDIIEETESKSEIDIVLDDQGSHGDNFGSLLGFHLVNSQDGSQFINEMVVLSSIQEPIYKNNTLNISEVDFKETGGDLELIKIRTIKSKDKIISAFPYLKTIYMLPFETKQIIEWSHVGKLEAEIIGGGRDTFGFGFFATDYAINKNEYKSNKKININVSAFGLVLDKSDLTEFGDTKVSPDFATYMPNSDIPRPTYYDFIGTLNHFKEYKLTKDIQGYILNIKLINQEDQPDFFTIDMFINRENMRITKLNDGMKVSGVLWFQGEIA